MMEIPVKLFDRDVEKIKVGAGAFCFFPKENLEEAQVGYLYEKDKTESKRWVGKQFVVIGQNSVKAEPIIAKLDEPSLPIYTLINNERDSLEKVSHSFDEYKKVLDKIEKTDLYRRDEITNLLGELKEIVPKDSMYYWENVVLSAYDYYAD